jgi:hypothetical protein
MGLAPKTDRPSRRLIAEAKKEANAKKAAARSWPFGPDAGPGGEDASAP